MDCKKNRDLFSHYIENQLDEEGLKIFEKHMEECDECRSEFYKLEKMILKIKQIKDLEPPKELKSKIMTKVMAEENKRLNAKILNFRKYSSVVATFLVVFIGFALYKSFGNNISQKYKNDGILQDKPAKARVIEQPLEELSEDTENNSTVFKDLPNTEQTNNLFINLYSKGIDIQIKTTDIELAKNFLIENIEDTKKFEESPKYLEFVINKSGFLELQKKCENIEGYSIEFENLDYIIKEIERIIDENIITKEGLIKFKAILKN